MTWRAVSVRPYPAVALAIFALGIAIAVYLKSIIGRWQGA
jgi:hypothetical protein